jgi:putative ABC transport system permease protein
MIEILRDLRLLARAVRRAPGFFALVVATMTAGIGGATAVYSVVETILLAPLPYPRADRLVQIESVTGDVAGPVSRRDLEDMREGTGVFVDLAAHTSDDGGFTMSDGDGPPHQARAVLATRNLFSVLGVELEAGGPWPESYDLERSLGVVLGHGLYRQRFAADPAVVGQALSLDGAPGYGVFGVAPEGFDYPRRTDLYRSIYISDFGSNVVDRGLRNYFGLGRLVDGVSMDDAQTRLDELAATLAERHPDTNRGVGFRLTSLREWYVGDLRPHLGLLTAGALLILVLAAANASNLLLARGFARQDEYALRAALGASRSRLVASLVAEGAAIGLTAALLGWLAARGGVEVLESTMRVDLPSWMVIEADGAILAASSIGAVLVGMACALAAALRLSRPTAVALSAASGRGVARGGARSLSRGLVGVEVALALCLLTAAAALVRGFDALLDTDPGFDRERVLTFQINLPYTMTEDCAAVEQFHARVVEGLAELPGAVSAAMSTNLPLTAGAQIPTARLVADGQDPVDAERAPPVLYSMVSAGYFEMLGIELRAGRGLDGGDRPETRRVAVVSESLARRFWPDADPVGRTLSQVGTGLANPWITRRPSGWPFFSDAFEVVGVVADVVLDPREDPVPHVYLSAAQTRPVSAHFAVRFATGDPVTRIADVERVVWGVDPLQPLWDIDTLERRWRDAVWRERLALSLLAAFSLLGLVLAASGVFGLVAFSVTERMREIGVAAALGAGRPTLLTGELRRAWMPVGIGLTLGAPAGAALTLLAARALPAMGGWSAGTALVTGLLLAVVGTGAALVPAARAARVDPARALRGEV